MYNGIYLCILVPLYEEKLIYFPLFIGQEYVRLKRGILF